MSCPSQSSRLNHPHYKGSSTIARPGLKTRTGASGTATLTESFFFFGRSPWLHGQLLFPRLATGLLLALLFEVPQRLGDEKGVLLLEGLSSFSLSGSSETSSYVLLDTICLGTFCL